MSVWHEITPISRTNPFCQETQGQTQQKKKVVLWTPWLSSVQSWHVARVLWKRHSQWYSSLALVLDDAATYPIQRSRWPTSHHHQPTTFQSAVSWSAPSLERCLRSNGGFVGLTWEAENHNIGQWGNATYPWGNLQNWDCAGAQALYDFLMRWLVHSATHAASRTHLILWAFVSLSAAGESNQHLWV